MAKPRAILASENHPASVEMQGPMGEDGSRARGPVEFDESPVYALRGNDRPASHLESGQVGKGCDTRRQEGSDLVTGCQPTPTLVVEPPLVSQNTCNWPRPVVSTDPALSIDPLVARGEVEALATADMRSDLVKQEGETLEAYNHPARGLVMDPSQVVSSTCKHVIGLGLLSRATLITKSRQLFRCRDWKHQTRCCKVELLMMQEKWYVLCVTWVSHLHTRPVKPSARQRELQHVGA